MKIKELKSSRTKSVPELQKLLDEKVKVAIKTKVEMKVSKEKNLKHVKMLRRDISQLNTILTEKKLTEIDTNKEKEKQKEA